MMLKRIITGARYLFCMAAVLAGLLMPSAAQAAESGLGLSVDGSMCDKIVVPGQTYTHTMTITSNSANPTLNITVMAAGLRQQADGSVVKKKMPMTSVPIQRASI